jgi:hypothetical protein
MTRFYTSLQPDQALKSPIFGRLHVSRSILCGDSGFVIEI